MSTGMFKEHSSKIHAVQVVASIREEAAGPSYSVRRLAESVASEGITSCLFSVGNADNVTKGDNVSYREFKRDFKAAPLISKMYMSKGLRQALNGAATSRAVLHAHGLWLMPNVYPSWSAARFGTPLVLAPRGMLGAEALKFSRLKKYVFWNWLQRAALERVSCFHATSFQEYEDIRRAGFRAPIAVIPNGIDVPPLDESSSHSGVGEDGQPSVLYLGRIHPKKGIEHLLKAWSLIEQGGIDGLLRIVGPLDGEYPQRMMALARSLKLRRISFDGPLYGKEKEIAYRASDIFILPTMNENFGMVVAEALVNDLPVICTKGAPWSRLVQEECGWWIDLNVEAIAATLAEAIQMPRAARKAMGRRGRLWMKREYSWSQVGKEVIELYEWCLGYGDRPRCVVRG